MISYNKLKKKSQKKAIIFKNHSKTIQKKQITRYFYTENSTLMSMELDDNYHVWKIKLELAQEGNTQAVEDIKAQSLSGNSEFSFIENNLHDALKNARIKYVKEGETYGSYELYSQVPIFLILQGQASLKCLNLQGDEQQVTNIKQKGVLHISKALISRKFGQANVNIVTKFHLACSKNSIVIEIDEEARRKIQSGEKQGGSLVGLREESIMKRYMLFPLKYIRIEEYSPGKTPKCEQKLYLLQGRACYYLQRGKQRIILTVYQQGYLNPKQFANSPQICLYIFQNSRILIFEEEFMRDDVVAAVESKRNQHIQGLVKGYERMAAQEKKKVQVRLINNFKLNKKEVDRAIYGIVEAVAKDKEKDQSSKRISTKNDLISTSSSIKEKCKIRISKQKKKII